MYIIYTTTYVCKQSCGFIINGVIVKDEENANYYPARRYLSSFLTYYAIQKWQKPTIEQIIFLFYLVARYMVSFHGHSKSSSYNFSKHTYKNSSVAYNLPDFQNKWEKKKSYPLHMKLDNLILLNEASKF